MSGFEEFESEGLPASPFKAEKEQHPAENVPAFARGRGYRELLS